MNRNKFITIISIIFVLSMVTGIGLFIYTDMLNVNAFDKVEKGNCEITDNNGIVDVKNEYIEKNKKTIYYYHAVEYKVIYNNKYKNVSIYSDYKIDRNDLDVDEYKVGDKLQCYVEISTGTPANGTFSYTSPSLILWLAILFFIVVPLICVFICNLTFIKYPDEE